MNITENYSKKNNQTNLVFFLNKFAAFQIKFVIVPNNTQFLSNHFLLSAKFTFRRAKIIFFEIKSYLYFFPKKILSFPTKSLFFWNQFHIFLKRIYIFFSQPYLYFQQTKFLFILAKFAFPLIAFALSHPNSCASGKNYYFRNKTKPNLNLLSPNSCFSQSDSHFS